MDRIFLLLSLRPVFLGLIGIIISGITFPISGVIILRNGLIPMRYMLMHGVILGGILSVCLKLPLLVTVIPLNIILVLIMIVLNKRGHQLSSAGTVMMVCTMGFASLLGHVFDVPAKDTLELLWGSPFALTISDLLIIGALGILIILYVMLCFRPISMVFFDSDIASSLGVNVPLHNTIMVLFTALIVSVAMKLIGALLIDALVVLPVVHVSKRATSLKKLFLYSSLSGFALSFSGYFVSLWFNLPVSGVIAVLATAVFIFVAVCERIGKKR